MRTIQHLPKEEKEHYILCNCGEYIDMRNLNEVFGHCHEGNLPQPQWSHAIKKGSPVAYTSTGKKLDLN
jgi:hypothetical protein